MTTRVAVVSGAAGGIGAAVVSRFVASGTSVVAVDIDAAIHRLERSDGSTRTMELDATKPDHASTAFDAALDAFGRVDAFVHCVGVSTHTHVLDITPALWSSLTSANLDAAFYLSQAACRVMATQRFGSIVLISSQLAEVGRANGAPYVASKGAIRSLAMALAIDMAPFGVRVNCVGPGVTDTPMLGARKGDEAAQRAWLDRIPMKRLATPDDVAAAVSFLAGQDAAYITGTTLYVDGGYLAT